MFFADKRCANALKKLTGSTIGVIKENREVLGFVVNFRGFRYSCFFAYIL